jgi:Fe-S-cluster containining protein
MEPHLYLPFADGLIGYDCISCGAGCCVDGLLGVGPVERRFLTGRYPDLHYFFRESSSGDSFAFYEKFKPTCWFLREDKYCSIERDFGRQYKPLLCRTHPVYFTPLFNEGIVLVWLGPVCFWQTSGDLSKATGIVSWDEINDLHKEQQEISYYETLPMSGQVMNAVQRLSQIVDLRTLIKVEEKIRDSWKDFDNYDQYLSWQLAYSNAFLVTRDPETEVSPEEYHRTSLFIEQLSQNVQSFLQVEETDNSPENERVLFLFTPILRLAWMGLIVEIPESIVESKVDPHTLYHTIPKALLVMSIFSKIFSTVNPSSQRSIDYNMLIQLFLHFTLRIFALSCFGSYINLGQIKNDLVVRKDSQNKVEKFVNSVDPIDSSSIGAYITEFCKDFTIEEKMGFMDDIGRSIRGVEFLPDFLTG